VVGEEPVEDVGAILDAELQKVELLHLFQIREGVGGGDRHPLLELGILSRLQAEPQLVDPLGECHPVLAFPGGHGAQHGPDVVVLGDVGPGRQVAVRPGLGLGHPVQQP
jgi:hypothetical protein